jgi:hypothetical protein
LMNCRSFIEDVPTLAQALPSGQTL